MRLNLNLFSIFQITVVTTGWISLAFTFRGNPIGSDIIVGWVGESSEAALIVSATFNFSTQMTEKLANKYVSQKKLLKHVIKIFFFYTVLMRRKVDMKNRLQINFLIQISVYLGRQINVDLVDFF